MNAQPSATSHPTRFKPRTRTLLVAVLGTVAALVLAIGGGAAYGYFTAHGSGTGSARTSTMGTVTITATAGSPSTPLLPNLKGDLAFNVQNNGSVPVSITSISLKSGGSITDGSGCMSADSSAVTLITPTNLPYSITATNGGSQSVDLANAVKMDSAAPNTCQGATFSVPITITVHEG